MNDLPRFNVGLSLEVSTCMCIADRLARSRIGFNAPESDRPLRWMKTREAADHLGLSLSELHRCAAAGEVPHVQDGGPGSAL